MSDFTAEDDALLRQLGVESGQRAIGGKTPREERLIAAFEDIQNFVDEHGRAPQHGENRELFERIFATRLERIRGLPECQTLLGPLDRQQLLSGGHAEHSTSVGEMDDDALLAELGVESTLAGINSLTHVRSNAEKRSAEEIANRKPCADFAEFQPVFFRVRAELDAGVRQTRPFQKMAEIQKGQWFIVEGQLAYVAEVGDEFVTEYDRRDSRLRVIYDNGTESDVLLRSLQRALHRDDAGRRVTDPDPGPLFSGELEAGDESSGTIYVLRSESQHPLVVQNRAVLHKIGVTGGDVQRRIAQAELDPTFLLARVDLIATYQLSNINRSKLEALIHRVFDPVRLKIEITDRFGIAVVPREWFLVPLFVIDEAVERIKDGTIVNYVYDAQSATLKPMP